MATIELLERPLAGSTASDDELDHIYCECDENVALCGADVSGCEIAYDDPEEDECVVCVDLLEHPCERCGRV